MRPMILLIVVACVAACTPPEEKVTKLITQELTNCKAAEGDFYEVTVVGGKDKILRDVCSLPIEGVEIIEEYSAKAKVGPYQITAGIDTGDTGIWMLKGVHWRPLEKAQNASHDEATAASRERGLDLWKQAQSDLPDNRYVRTQRWRNALELRRKTRGKSDNPLGLGGAQAVYDEMVKWGAEKDPEFAELIKVDTVEYHKSQADKLEISLENIGSTDGHLESLIRQARKDKSPKDAERYQKQLDDSRAGRDAIIQKVETQISDAQKNACTVSKTLNVGKIQDAELKKRANSVRSGLSCS